MAANASGLVWFPVISLETSTWANALPMMAVMSRKAAAIRFTAVRLLCLGVYFGSPAPDRVAPIASTATSHGKPHRHVRDLGRVWLLVADEAVGPEIGDLDLGGVRARLQRSGSV